MYWAFKLFIHRYTCPSKIHSLEEPSPWLFSAISWPLTRVQLLLSFWWVQFCLIERYYLYIFLCAYPTIPYWPTHFVLKLTILLFVISFSTYSKIPTKKKTQFLWNIWSSLLIAELIGIWLLFGLSLNIVNTVTTWLQFIPLIHWSSLCMHSCLTLILHWELVTWIFRNLNCIHKYCVACIYVVVASCQTLNINPLPSLGPR